jgi:hypothetical protein
MFSPLIRGPGQNLRSGVARATTGENEKGAAKRNKAKNKYRRQWLGK